MFDFERPREELNAGAPHQATPHAVRVFASLTAERHQLSRLEHIEPIAEREIWYGQKDDQTGGNGCTTPK